MAKYAHTVSYRQDGSGPILETTILAESVDAAKEKFAAVFPKGRIEKVLTVVPPKG